jgi:hypothetical protein
LGMPQIEVVAGLAKCCFLKEFVDW